MESLNPTTSVADDSAASEQAADRELSDRVQAGLAPGGDAGDAGEAYMALYDRHAGALAAYIGRIAHASAVDDIAQDVWRRAWEILGEQRLNSPFRPWLFTVARNRVTDSWREAARRKAENLETTSETPTNNEAGIEQGLIDEEAKAALGRCLERLEEKQVAIVRGRWGGQDYEQICSEHGIDHNQAYKAYHKASKQLTDCVKRAGVV